MQRHIHEDMGGTDWTVHGYGIAIKDLSHALCFFRLSVSSEHVGQPVRSLILCGYEDLESGPLTLCKLGLARFCANLAETSRPPLLASVRFGTTVEQHLEVAIGDDLVVGSCDTDLLALEVKQDSGHLRCALLAIASSSAQ